MTRLLCLDVDGVVITGREPDGAHWSAGLQADLGVARDDLVRTFFKPHWAAIVTGQKPMRPALDDALHQIGTAVNADQLIDYWFRKDARLNRPLLTALGPLRARGIRVVLATNQEPQRRAYLWHDLGLCQHVDKIYGSADLGCAKPAPAFFAAIEQAEQTPPDQITFLDDDPTNVAAADGRGWQAYHIAAPSDAVAVLEQV